MLDFCPYPEAKSGSVRASTGECFECDLWSEAIVEREAEAVATYEVGPLAGGPPSCATPTGRAKFSTSGRASTRPVWPGYSIWPPPVQA